MINAVTSLGANVEVFVRKEFPARDCLPANSSSAERETGKSNKRRAVRPSNTSPLSLSDWSSLLIQSSVVERSSCSEGFHDLRADLARVIPLIARSNLSLSIFEQVRAARLGIDSIGKGRRGGRGGGFRFVVAVADCVRGFGPINGNVGRVVFAEQLASIWLLFDDEDAGIADTWLPSKRLIGGVLGFLWESNSCLSI